MIQVSIKNNNQVKYYVLLALFSIAISFLAVYFCAFFFSPLYEHFLVRPETTDSTFFMVLGRMLAEGATPYIDVLDHKGPYLFYFLELAALIDPLWGFYIFQSIISSICLFCALDIGHELGLRKGYSAVYFFATFILLFLIHDFVTLDASFIFCTYIPLWLFVKAYKTKNYKLYTASCLSAGLSIGILIFSRATSAVVPCIIALAVFLHSLFDKDYANLPLYILFGVFGIVLACAIPIVISSAGGYLDEMFTWTFTKNGNYIFASLFDFSNWRIDKLGVLLFSSLTMLILPYCIYKTHKEKEKHFAIIVISMILIDGVFNLLASLLLHHLQMSYPIYLLGFTGLLNYVKLKINNKNQKKSQTNYGQVLAGILSAITIIYIFAFPYVSQSILNNYPLYSTENIYKQREVKSYIEEKYDGDAKVIVLDLDPSIYMNLNTLPSYKVYSNQFWWYNTDVYPNIDKELETYFSSKDKPDLIFTICDINESILSVGNLNQTVQENYTLLENYSYYPVWYVYEAK